MPSFKEESHRCGFSSAVQQFLTIFNKRCFSWDSIEKAQTFIMKTQLVLYKIVGKTPRASRQTLSGCLHDKVMMYRYVLHHMEWWLACMLKAFYTSSPWVDNNIQAEQFYELNKSTLLCTCTFTLFTSLKFWHNHYLTCLQHSLHCLNFYVLKSLKWYFKSLGWRSAVCSATIKPFNCIHQCIST